MASSRRAVKDFGKHFRVSMGRLPAILPDVPE
jgi:hypothetical protein